jgi:hypothetical protein
MSNSSRLRNIRRKLLSNAEKPYYVGRMPDEPERLLTRFHNILQNLRFRHVPKADRFSLRDQDSPDWQARADHAVRLWIEHVAEAGELDDRVYKIADFGCGDEKLKTVIGNVFPGKYQYWGYDLSPQTDAGLQINLESEMPGIPFDAVFCLGLLEYISDLDRFLVRLRGNSRRVIASYVNLDSGAYTRREIRKRGWVSRYSRRDLERKFAESGLAARKFRLTNENRTGLWLLETSG